MLCDELLICEGSQCVSFPEFPERSDDGTLDIISDKTRQYPGKIKIVNTIRKYENYRDNQCANFNAALNHCKIGDYFIQLDADEFLLDSCIPWVNDLMAQEAFDVLWLKEYHFAYSFKWSMILNGDIIGPVIYRKTPGFGFRPTHMGINVGKRVIKSDEIVMFHYTWLKSKVRIGMRFKTSGRRKGMVKFFNESWNNIKLGDGKTHNCWSGRTLTLKRYDGEHPFILDNHPWRHIEDVRKLHKC